MRDRSPPPRRGKIKAVYRLEDAPRAMLLDAAQRGIGDLERAMKRDRPFDNYDRIGTIISVELLCEAGGQCVESIEIDNKTARKLLPFLLNVIGDELAYLEVTAAKPRVTPITKRKRKP